MLQNTEWCNDKKDNPEKLETQRTQDVEKKTKTQHNKHWTPPYANKTYVLSQTTGGKDKPNIAFMMEDYHKKMICKRSINIWTI
jgi:hypothetical protein